MSSTFFYEVILFGIPLRRAHLLRYWKTHFRVDSSIQHSYAILISHIRIFFPVIFDSQLMSCQIYWIESLQNYLHLEVSVLLKVFCFCRVLDLRYHGIRALIPLENISCQVIDVNFIIFAVIESYFDVLIVSRFLYKKDVLPTQSADESLKFEWCGILACTEATVWCQGSQKIYFLHQTETVIAE